MVSRHRYFVLLILLSLFGCDEQPSASCSSKEYCSNRKTFSSDLAHLNTVGKGALLLSRFQSLEELKMVVQFEYSNATSELDSDKSTNSKVQLLHCGYDNHVISTLIPGVSELDFVHAKEGNLWNKIRLGLNSPYAVSHKEDLMRIELLARRTYRMFGEGDIAFYDLAETTVKNISNDYLKSLSLRDLSDKGFLNTFNHITAQAMITSIFSEKLADFIADAHERYHMPELITGEFTQDQILDLDNGPLDNYIDMINNEWGQEIGKHLKQKYNITSQTYWTPQLLANYLNDLQSYYSWSFHIGFKPFRTSDDLIIRYTDKINRVVLNQTKLKSYSY